MGRKEDEILARELGKLGRLGGEIGGGKLTGLSEGIGAYIAAKLLPNNACEISRDINAKPDNVLKVAFNILNREGKITEEIKPTSEFPTFFSIVGSGFLNMNPALVSIEVIPVSEGLTRIIVRGTAKEGLIKQRAGEKAAHKVADLLVESFRTH